MNRDPEPAARAAMLAPAPPAAASAGARGVFYLLAGVAVFSLQDVIIKSVSGSYPLPEAMTLRCVVALPLLLILAHLEGGIRLIASPRSPLLLARAGILLVAYFSYYLALAALPLAESVSLYFTAPLFITLLAGVALGEPVGARRWGAVTAGFLGVLVMLRPGSGLTEPAALLPVLSGLAYGTAQVMARRLGASEPASVLGFYQNGVFLLAALLLGALVGDGVLAGAGHASVEFLLRAWRTPSLADFLLMAACGPISAAGIWLLGNAYRTAEAALLAPFEYTALIWATLWGFLVWHDVPGLHTLAGASLLIGAGLYALHRERVLRKLSRSP